MEGKLRFFSIDGHWKDGLIKFTDYIVSESDEVDDEIDDSIFYYGLSEDKIKEAINNPDESGLEFVITNYNETFFQ